MVDTTKFVPYPPDFVYPNRDTNVRTGKTHYGEPPARSDIAATKQTISIDSVLETEYEHFDIDFIFESFYLPVQVLRNPLYVIQPIKVIEGKDFNTWVEKDDHTIFVSEGCCLRMLQNAKYVGISKRHILSSGQRIAICKVWYGRI